LKQPHWPLSEGPTITHMLNIDTIATNAEIILSKYVERQIYCNNVWYVRGKRCPLSSRSIVDKYKKTNLLSNKPWHPYLILPVLADFLEHYQYGYTSYPELFMGNTLMKSMSSYNTTPDTTDVDIILSYVPNIEDGDLQRLVKIFYALYKSALKPIYINAPDAIYVLNTDTSMYYLAQHEDIRAYRYMELSCSLEG